METARFSLGESLKCSVTSTSCSTRLPNIAATSEANFFATSTAI